MEKIAIDILGPLPMTDHGKKYIMVIADYFTKWVEAYLIPNQEAETIARVLVDEFIVRFGVPDRIHTDQGRNFESHLFSKVCRILQVKKTRTTAFHPQSDGIIERLNRTLEEMLSKVVDKHHKDRDHCLPFVLMAYRSSRNETTGCSPNEMLFGREITLPIDVILDRGVAEEGMDHRRQDSHYVLQLLKRLRETHEYAPDNIDLSQTRQKRNYDRRANEQPLKIKDKVWLYNPTKKKGLSPKLMRFWD